MARNDLRVGRVKEAKITKKMFMKNRNMAFTAVLLALGRFPLSRIALTVTVSELRLLTLNHVMTDE